ncbi:hypothetical protein DPMN_121605 [Dreissena polymorpha]|uniref:Uncharacterized protein n=1 Tax=Dreissena polymorpha TaxID=45954 RepID=A0A9D4GN20_DREPO|nr:hypothetical protein DPMN_121605 [Dreissena polymorpha]
MTNQVSANLKILSTVLLDCNADTSTDSGQFSVWYLDVDRAPEWIQLEITDVSITV